MNAIFIFLAHAAAALALPAEEGELKFVVFVHRHGDRSPVGTYPNDPYGNESLWNNGWGELTTAGKRSAYDLGKWMRKRYAGFLPAVYNKNDYEVRSTDVSRALMSGYSVLAGLYEPTGTDVWHPDIKWQPIPVHTIPVDEDNVLAAEKPCPKHARLFVRLLLSSEIATRLGPLADALSEVVRHAGYNSTNVLADFLAAAMICDVLKVQKENGFELPDWTRSYFPQPLEDVRSLMLKLATYNEPLQRLSCGLLVQDILRHLIDKAMGRLPQKMWQYSAHDVTIVGLRQCLGFDELESPPYASALIFELTRQNEDYFVKLLYKAEDTLNTLVVPDCSEKCPLEKFEALVKPIIPRDWDAECLEL